MIKNGTHTLRSNAGGSANWGPRLVDTNVAAAKRMRSALNERRMHNRCRYEHLFSQSPGRGDSSGFAVENHAFQSRGDCQITKRSGPGLRRVAVFQPDTWRVAVGEVGGVSNLYRNNCVHLLEGKGEAREAMELVELCDVVPGVLIHPILARVRALSGPVP